MRTIWPALLVCPGLLLGACGGDGEGIVSVPAAAEDAPNPERGFYHHTAAHSGRYEPLDADELRSYRRDENITLILRVFYLEDFVSAPISAEYLSAMQEDFATLRQAGLKAILRFAYTDETTGSPPEPPFGDAAPERILAHVDQLATLLVDNIDVIAVVQAGLIGIWGEWHYSDYFTPDEDYAGRKTLVLALQDALAGGRVVQVRTPGYKQGMFGTSSGAAGALPEADAWTGSAIALTGHHNDCFLASRSDFGTYDDVAADKAYLAIDTRYVPMGGETCAVSERSTCATALNELTRFHWSYLNIDYHPDVLGGFISDGCMQEIQLRLGYRLLLRSASLSASVRPGSAFRAELELVNEGFAAPMNARPVRLLLRHSNSGAVHGVSLPEDPRTWLPEADIGPISLDYEVCTTADLPEGEYELLLHLPDAAEGLAGDPAYAIRLANADQWESRTGYNPLGETITVDVDAASSTCNTSLTLESGG